MALVAIAQNLTRLSAALASHGLRHASTATIRRTPLTIPARWVRSARCWHLRMLTIWAPTDRVVLSPTAHQHHSHVHLIK